MPIGGPRDDSLRGRDPRQGKLRTDSTIRGQVKRGTGLIDDELTKRLATVPPEIPDIRPNVAGVYRRKVARLAKALGKPEERDAAAAAIRGLIDGIVLTPGEKRGELQVTLRGELGKILGWTGSGLGNRAAKQP